MRARQRPTPSPTFLPDLSETIGVVSMDEDALIVRQVEETAAVEGLLIEAAKGGAKDERA